MCRHALLAGTENLYATTLPIPVQEPSPAHRTLQLVKRRGAPCMEGAQAIRYV